MHAPACSYNHDPDDISATVGLSIVSEPDRVKGLVAR